MFLIAVLFFFKHSQFNIPFVILSMTRTNWPSFKRLGALNDTSFGHVDGLFHVCQLHWLIGSPANNSPVFSEEICKNPFEPKRRAESCFDKSSPPTKLPPGGNFVGGLFLSKQDSAHLLGSKRF